MKIKSKNNEGQATIFFLFLTGIITTLVLEIVSLSFSSIQLDNDYSEGMALLIKAESYLENGALKFLRNPNYSGEVINDGETTCTIQIVALPTPGQKDITSSCQNNLKVRKVGTTAVYDNGLIKFSSTRERI